MPNNLICFVARPAIDRSILNHSVVLNIDIWKRAIALERPANQARAILSLWGRTIVAAAIEDLADSLLSEDLVHSRVLGGVNTVDPFA